MRKGALTRYSTTAITLGYIWELKGPFSFWWGPRGLFLTMTGFAGEMHPLLMGAGEDGYHGRV